MIDVSKLSNQFSVRRLGDEDADIILHLCGGNPMYYHYCRTELTREQVLADLHALPPGIGAEDKYYTGFFRDQELVAVMDLIDGYPESDYGFIGFFMMNAALQGREIGSGIIQEVCAYLKQTGKRAVRLGIAKDNPQATRFWKKNGFLVIREAARDGWTVLVAEKRLEEL